MQLYHMKTNFPEIFADKIIKEFMGDVKMRQVDPPLIAGEEPIQFIVEKKFMIVDEYFTHPQYPLPKILKKLAGESELVHQERVKKYLIACDDTTFSGIANMIDPENQFQMGFFNLYNDAMGQRINLRQTQSPEEEKKGLRCNIF